MNKAHTKVGATTSWSMRPHSKLSQVLAQRFEAAPYSESSAAFAINQNGVTPASECATSE